MAFCFDCEHNFILYIKQRSPTLKFVYISSLLEHFIWSWAWEMLIFKIYFDDLFILFAAKSFNTADQNK